MLRRLFKRQGGTGPGADGSAHGSKPPAAGAATDGTLAERLATASARARADLLAEVNDVTTLRELAADGRFLAPCADRLAGLDGIEQALALAASDEARAELAIASQHPPLREQALASLQSEAALALLERRSRDRHKVTNREARRRLERLRQARQALQAAQAEAGQLAESIRRLPADSYREVRYAALSDQWQALCERWQEAAGVLEAHAETVPAVPPLPEPPAMETPPEAEPSVDFGAIAARFSAVREQLSNGAAPHSVAETLTSLGSEWRAALALATPEAGQISQVERCVQLYENLDTAHAALDALYQRSETMRGEPPPPELKAAGDTLWEQVKRQRQHATTLRKALAGIRWPEAATRPAPLAELTALAGAQRAFLEAADQHASELERGFISTVEQLGKQLEAGEFQPAGNTLNNARAQQQALPPGSAQRARNRLQSLGARLMQMRDWQHYATDPKREQLCEAMEALANTPLAPTEQANEVKALRAQWRELGGKGPKALADRFEAAAATAFEPCRVHYAEQAELRTANLARREAIAETLATYLETTDWARADMNAARSILQQARAEWREAFPVERSGAKALEKRFKTLTDALYQHVRDDGNANLQKKTQLVEQAEALLTDERPLPARLDEAKDLQQAWRDIGPTPRAADQKLWKRLRDACDQLFGERDRERDARREAESARASAAQDRLTAFEAELDATAADAIDRSLLAALRRDLKAHEPLGGAERKRLQALTAAFEQRLGARHQAEAARRLDELEIQDQAVAAAERAAAALPDAALALLPAFAKRAAGKHDPRDLTLEAEWLAGIESPAADAQRRLELQVAWLNQGMNGTARERPDPLALAERWCTLAAGADTAAHDGFRERLFAACKTLLQSASQS